jgi:hypothetical protein
VNRCSEQKYGTNFRNKRSNICAEIVVGWEHRGQPSLIAGKELLSEIDEENGPSVKRATLVLQSVKANASTGWGTSGTKIFRYLLFFSLHSRTFGRLSDGTRDV